MSSQVSTLPRQSLNARQTQTLERLFAAASEVLTEVGHEALTIRMVAGRAGVSAATAYTYVASKDHLFAELFCRLLAADTGPAPTGATPTARLQETTRHLALLIGTSPALAAATTKSLLGEDPQVRRLRLRIGAAFVVRFRAALGDAADPWVLESVTLAFFGALLQAGMGLVSYADLAPRLDQVVAVIMKGNA
ncbi:helix-turn-helix domain-containing protein [Cryptosporangium japonicum]|uniref:TetR/AcrR family transcriptional regulator n=1 Tax=Cryptosporangium japonicum TaxID=80872 RepID=A0ABN0UGB6_9ACTN